MAIDPATATAARLVREMFTSPRVTDLCAGSRSLDVAALACFADAVSTLNDGLVNLLAVARSADRSVYAYTFDVVNASGQVTSAITIRARGNGHGERLRGIAANMLVENHDLYADGIRLSHDAPRVTPSPE